MSIREVVHRFRTRGLVGPAYSGLVGKALLAFEELVVRREVVLVAEPGSLADDSVETAHLELVFVRSFTALAQHADEIDVDHLARDRIDLDVLDHRVALLIGSGDL